MHLMYHPNIFIPPFVFQITYKLFFVYTFRILIHSDIYLPTYLFECQHYEIKYKIALVTALSSFNTSG